jgi:hypothetical protein
MTDNPLDLDPPPTEPRRASSIWAWLGSAAQLLIALALTITVLVYLLTTPLSRSGDENIPKAPPEAVRPYAPMLLRVEAGSKLENRVQIVSVQSARIKSPVMYVTGVVVASLRPGSDQGPEYWQFNAPEILSAYTDYEKAIADITFNEKQVELVKHLNKTRVEAQEKLVARLERLEKGGTGTLKELAAEQANLIQFQIQGRKETYEAETALRLAQRNAALQSRQLQQAGLDPALLKSVTSDVDIVMGDVPEGDLSRVKIGQGVEARFFGVAGQVFTGRVNSIAPVLSKERRSLRVLFTINDLKDQLRPGMFTEIGLGTDPRDALLVPADGVVHVGRSDYVLVATEEAGLWRVVEVCVGEPQGNLVEILTGDRGCERIRGSATLKSTDRIIGKGAILLKPALVRTVGVNSSEGGQ